MEIARWVLFSILGLSSDFVENDKSAMEKWADCIVCLFSITPSSSWIAQDRNLKLVVKCANEMIQTNSDQPELNTALIHKLALSGMISGGKRNNSAFAVECFRAIAPMKTPSSNSTC